MKHFNDISDDEIRIIGNKDDSQEKFYKKWWFLGLIVLLLALIGIIFLIWKNSHNKPIENIENVSEEIIVLEPTTTINSDPATVIVIDTVINDVPLTTYTPTNAYPELVIGIPDVKDTSILLAFQAADIRADNREIVGAFVLKGELLSKGSAKKGFCAIIDNVLNIGIAESTSLLEEAIDQDGYFFRQYPLVNGGKVVESKLKNKSIRNALCELNGKVVVVSSNTAESLHDFSQALVDLGVNDAIYLVGGAAMGFCKTCESDVYEWGDSKYAKSEPNTNFIVWKRFD